MSYCGLCNVTGKRGVPRPAGETAEEFRAHVATHSADDQMRIRTAYEADLLYKIAPHIAKHDRTPLLQECFCCCHLKTGNGTAMRLVCSEMAPDERTCTACNRVGKDRYFDPMEAQ